MTATPWLVLNDRPDFRPSNPCITASSAGNKERGILGRSKTVSHWSQWKVESFRKSGEKGLDVCAQTNAFLFQALNNTPKCGTCVNESITASIVLYKTPESQLNRLLGCITSSSLALTTYLVDNSPAGLDYSCFRHPSFIYIRANSNNGYGAGHNIALRKIIDSSDFHFVLNPDIYFEPTELEKMVRFIETDPTIGHLMPKVVYPDGSLQYLCKLLPTPLDLLVRRFSFGPFRRIAERRAERFELRYSNYDMVMDVPYLSGCFMLLRTCALRRIGLFDERFFMYPEDVDLTRRMHAEFRTVFYPEATVVHDHARDSYRNTRALFVHMYNIAKYFNKWGWLYDTERTRMNRETLDRLQ